MLDRQCIADVLENCSAACRGVRPCCASSWAIGSITSKTAATFFLVMRQHDARGERVGDEQACALVSALSDNDVPIGVIWSSLSGAISIDESPLLAALIGPMMRPSSRRMTSSSSSGDMPTRTATP